MKNLLLLFTLVFSVTLKAQITANIAVRSEFCTGNNATILIEATGGDGNYVYAVSFAGTIPSESSFTSNNSIQNLTFGDYDVYVRDNNGAIGYDESVNSATIEESPPLVVFASVLQSPICDSFFGGEIIVEATGGDGSYIYEITEPETGATYSQIGNNIFSNLSSGIYIINVIDGNNCISEIDVELIESEPVEFDITVVENISCVENSGSVSINVTSGFPPYTIQINNDANTSITTNDTNFTYVNLPAGVHVISVFDAYGCENIQNFILEEEDEFTADVAFTNPSCNGDNNGNIIINATGGTGVYNYVLEDSTGTIGAPQDSNVFTGLASGDYIVGVNSGNCSYSITVTLEEPESIAFTTTILPSGNEPSGSIILLALGGTLPYEYSIDGSFMDSNQFLNLASGPYSVIIRDANGCTYTDTVIIDQVNVDNSVSVDSTEGLVATYKDAIEYQWINANTGEEILDATEVNYIPTEDGNYQVKMIIEDGTAVVSAKRTSSKSTLASKSALATRTVLSPIINFSTSVLSISNILSVNLNVYPNPANDFINLPSSLANTNYSIFNTLGRQIQKGEIKETKLLLTSLSKGMYFLQVPGYNTVKFIKK